MSSGSTSRATRSPATRSSAANSASTRAMPSTRSRSSARQDRIQSLGFFQEKLEIKQTAGLGARPGRARRRRRGKVDRRAAAVGRLFEPREVRRLRLDRPAQFHGQGPAAQRRRQLVALFAVGRSSASPSPICSTSRSCSAATSTAATTTASTIIGDERNTTYSPESAPAAGCGSASRSPNSSASARATRWSRTRSRSTRALSSPIPTATGPARARVRSGQGRALSVRRNRQAADLVARLFAGLRQHQRHPRRRAASGSSARRISPGLGGDVKYLRTRARRDQIFRAAARASSSRPMPRAATSTRCRIRRAKAATRSGSPTASSARRCAASTSAASARAFMRTPYDIDGDCWSKTTPDQRRARRPRLLYGPARTRIPDQLGAPQPRLAAVGLRRRRVGLEADQRRCSTDVLATSACRQPARHRRRRSSRSWRRRIQLPGYRHDAAPTIIVRSTGSRKTFLGNSPKPRLSVGVGVNWVSPFGPLRIDLAKALLKQEGDDTKLFSLQRRNPILMTNLLLPRPLPRSSPFRPPPLAQALPRAGRSPSSTSERVMTAVHRLQDRARPSLQTQVNGAADAADSARRRRCRPKRAAIQTAVNALNGKQPDAALQARVKAFQTRSRPMPSASFRRASSTFQRNRRPMSCSRSTPKLEPDADQR